MTISISITLVAVAVLALVVYLAVIADDRRIRALYVVTAVLLSLLVIFRIIHG